MALTVQDRLSKMKVKELREFAKKHSISLKGLRKKVDIVAVIAAVEDIDNLLLEDEAEELKKDEEETAEIGEDVQEIVEEAEKLPPLEDEEADPVIIEG
ncbi:MAG: hypothetical protein KAU99_02170, partial [Thermoplasmata archaeon]|nr:hypothetical protein [Thermoplasmata archaeon]